MGKRTRSTLAYIATRLDVAILELQRLNARLPEPADTPACEIMQGEIDGHLARVIVDPNAPMPAPDDAPFTYYPADNGYIKYIKHINRAPAWTLDIQPPEPDSRTPIQRAAADAQETWERTRMSDEAHNRLQRAAADAPEYG